MESRTDAADVIAGELVRKYRTLLALRRQLPDRAHPRPLDGPERAAVRKLASEFPGALRELDSLPTDELEQRLRSCERALSGTASLELWAAQVGAYHAWMSVALAARQPEPLAEQLFAQIAQRWRISIDREFVARARKPEGRRLMSEVFNELSRQFGEPVEVIWQRLFPAKGARAYRGLAQTQNR